MSRLVVMLDCPHETGESDAVTVGHHGDEHPAPLVVVHDEPTS